MSAWCKKVVKFLFTRSARATPDFPRSDWRFAPSHSLIIIVKTITRNRLSTAARARLQVAADLVQPAARHPAIVALRMLQIILVVPVRDAVKLLRIDDELQRRHLRALAAVPSWFL